MSKRDHHLLIEDILDSINKINTYTSGLTFNEFVSSDITVDAVVRNFEIIGEASNQFHPDFRINNPNVPWIELRGLRNRLIHEYFGVDYEIIWQVINNELAELKRTFQELS